MQTRVLSNLTPFFRVERIHQCLQDSGAFITGDIVLKMIHGGSWSESNITLVVNYTLRERNPEKKSRKRLGPRYGTGITVLIFRSVLGHRDFVFYASHASF